MSLRLFIDKIWCASNRGIFTSSCLYAEPLRKKKRIDPVVLKRRHERKMRKLEKEIERLEKTPKQLKPIVELQLPPQILKELDKRKRQEVDEQAKKELLKLTKLWSIYKMFQSNAEIKSIKSMICAQNKALQHLKMHSTKLYEDAISVDPLLLPFQVNDPIKETPASEKYEPPDGKLVDVTKQWTM